MQEMFFLYEKMQNMSTFHLEGKKKSYEEGKEATFLLYNLKTKLILLSNKKSRGIIPSCPHMFSSSGMTTDVILF